MRRRRHAGRGCHDRAASSRPAAVARPDGATAGGGVDQLIAGGDDTCVHTVAGDWRCWGEDKFGQLGPDPHTVSCGRAMEPARCLAEPTRLDGVDGAAKLALEGAATCALGTDHVVRCWGADYQGFLGRGAAKLDSCALDTTAGQVGTVDLATGKVDSDPSGLRKVSVQIPCGRTPAPIAGNVVATGLAVGEGFACVTEANAVACWGTENDGRLGFDARDTCGDMGCARTATALPGMPPVKSIVLGNESGAAITASGGVVTWGSGLGGQLGRTGRKGPAVVAGLDHVVQLALGVYFDCALVADGTVRCWGMGDSGSLGLGKLPVDQDGMSTVPTPTVVPHLEHVTALAASPGGEHACALLEGGKVSCWGANSTGQLGVGDLAEHLTPTAVPGLSGVSALALGSHHTCALIGDGAVWCWGADENKQLATAHADGAGCKLGTLSDTGTVPCSLSPVRIPGL